MTTQKPLKLQLKKFSEELSIRKGKYGDYIYYKTKTMKRPKFINVSKIKDVNNICNLSEKELLERINNLIAFTIEI